MTPIPRSAARSEEFTKATGIDVTVEFINQNDMAARITAAIESGDRSRRHSDERQSAAPLRQRSCRSWLDLFGEMGGDDFYEWASGAVTVDGVARSIPLFNIGNAVVYQ